MTTLTEEEIAELEERIKEDLQFTSSLEQFARLLAELRALRAERDKIAKGLLRIANYGSTAGTPLTLDMANMALDLRCTLDALAEVSNP